MKALKFISERLKEKTTRVAIGGQAAVLVAMGACAQGTDSGTQLAATTVAYIAAITNSSVAHRQFLKSSVVAATVLLGSLFGPQNAQLIMQVIAGGILLFQILKKEETKSVVEDVEFKECDKELR